MAPARRRTQVRRMATVRSSMGASSGPDRASKASAPSSRSPNTNRTRLNITAAPSQSEPDVRTSQGHSRKCGSEKKEKKKRASNWHWCCCEMRRRTGNKCNRLAARQTQPKSLRVVCYDYRRHQVFRRSSGFPVEAGNLSFSHTHTSRVPRAGY